MPTPADLTTKLKAVNIILVGMGESPIESLEAVESSLAQKAIDALDEASRTVQAIGWYWNTERDYPLTADSGGTISLPANTLEVSEVMAESKDCVQRGQRLYNRTDHTFTFTVGLPVKVNLTVWLDWDDLPEFAKHPIHYIATRRFQMRELTSTAIDGAVKDDVDAALTVCQQAEDRQGPANYFTDSPDGAAFQGVARRRR